MSKEDGRLSGGITGWSVKRLQALEGVLKRSGGRSRIDLVIKRRHRKTRNVEKVTGERGGKPHDEIREGIEMQIGKG